MKRFLLGLIILNTPLSANALSFEQAWQLVLANDAQLSAARQRSDALTHLGDSYQDLSLPRVDLTANYIQLEKPVALDLADIEPFASLNNFGFGLETLAGATTVTDFTQESIGTVSLQAILPLYTGGKITAAKAIGQQQAISATAELEMLVNEQFEVLVQRYFSVNLAQKVVEFQIDYLNAVSGHLEAAEHLERQGQIARVERLAAQVAFDDAKLGVSRAQHMLSLSRAALRSLVGKPIPETSTALFSIDQLPILASYTEDALTSFPGFALLDSKLDQTESAINLQQSEYYPEFFLFGNYLAYEEDSLAADITPDWQVGVGMSMTLVSNTGRSSRLSAAQNTRMEVQSLINQAKVDISLATQQAYQQAGQALEEYRLLVSSELLAKENIKLREAAFAQGLATTNDVVDAHAYESAVKVRRMNALFEFVQYFARLNTLSANPQRFIAASKED